MQRNLIAAAAVLLSASSADAAKCPRARDLVGEWSCDGMLHTTLTLSSGGSFESFYAAGPGATVTGSWSVRACALELANEEMEFDDFETGKVVRERSSG